MFRDCKAKPPDRGDEPTPIRERSVVVLPTVFAENQQAVEEFSMMRMMLEGLRTRDVQ